MLSDWKVVSLAIALAAVIAALLWRRFRQRRLIISRRIAVERFESRSPAVAEQFRAAADATGKPRGLRWKSCELGHDVRFAVDRVSGELFALAPVTISFEAIEGGGMEDVEAVSNLRSGTAIFVFHDGGWATDGRAVLNLDPNQTAAHYHETLQLYDELAAAGDDAIA